MSKGSTSAACSTALCWCPVSSVISDDLLDVVGPAGLRQDLFQAARPLGGQGGEPLAACSASSWRHRPQGMITSPLPLTQTKASRCPPPPAASSLTSPHSAHRVAP